MIKIILPNDSIEVTEPHYILKFNYSIGGETCDIITKTTKLSLNNPYIERAVYLLNNFLTDKELILEEIRTSYECDEFDEMSYKFLVRILINEDTDLEHYITGDNETLEDVEEYLDIYTYHADEFRDGVCTTTVEGSILVFEFVELVYINEYGNEFKTSIIRD